MYIIRKFNGKMTSAKWTLVIGKFSVILGIDYKVVSNERMGYVKV